MTFETFLNLIPKVQNLALPGRATQLEMAPTERIKEFKGLDIEALNPRQAAVTALFYPNKEQDTSLVLILRKTYKGVHSNQVGFPGGKVEDDDPHLEYTALRETEEEVGVPISKVNVFKKMTNIYIPPSNFWVQCYMSYIEATPTFIAQEEEVEAIIEVPLAQLLADTALISEKLSTSYMDEIEVPAYNLQGHTVWGATAMMLSEVRTLLLRASEG